jgi:hypothetical protein
MSSLHTALLADGETGGVGWAVSRYGFACGNSGCMQCGPLCIKRSSKQGSVRQKRRYSAVTLKHTTGLADVRDNGMSEHGEYFVYTPGIMHLGTGC